MLLFDELGEVTSEYIAGTTIIAINVEAIKPNMIAIQSGSTKRHLTLTE